MQTNQFRATLIVLTIVIIGVWFDTIVIKTKYSYAKSSDNQLQSLTESEQQFLNNLNGELTTRMPSLLVVINEIACPYSYYETIEFIEVANAMGINFFVYINSNKNEFQKLILKNFESNPMVFNLGASMFDQGEFSIEDIRFAIYSLDNNNLVYSITRGITPIDYKKEVINKLNKF